MSVVVTLEPVRLASTVGDHEGMLARCNGRLFAVLSCLGELHGELLGHWYVEAVFSTDLIGAGHVFASLDAFQAQVERPGSPAAL